MVSCGASALTCREEKKKTLFRTVWYWLALWVTDFLVLSKVEINIYLKLKHLVGDLPLIFHINRYTLVHDVVSSLCWDRVLVRQFVHRSLLERSSFYTKACT